MNKLTKADEEFIRAHYVKRSKAFGIKALAERFDVPKSAIEAALIGITWTRVTTCERCGAELTKWQRKYCNDCSVMIGRERSSETWRNGKRKRYDRNSPLNERNHMEWEADICLNCTRPSCNNCLQEKTIEQKEFLLERCGGKKWLD